MTVSILIPFYQVGPFIERCARSVLEQTYQDLEYIFIDDHSTDNGPAVLEQVLEEYPQRKKQVRIIRNPSNLGLASSRNLAVGQCTGTFLLWVDADDWITPTAVEQLVERQRQTDADIVTGRVMVVEDSRMFETPVSSGASKQETLVGLLTSTVFTMVWGRLIRTSLYRDHAIRCLDGVNYREDFQVLPLLFYYADQVADLDEVIYYYEQRNPLSYNALARHDFRIKLTKEVQDLASTRLVRDFFRDRLPEVNDINGKSLVWHLREIIRNSARAGIKSLFMDSMHELKQCPWKHTRHCAESLWLFAHFSPSLCWHIKRWRVKHLEPTVF